MAFDVAKWLKEDMKFSDEEVAEYSPKFGAKAEELERGYARQSDYSRNMDGLKAEKSKLETANDKLNRDMAEWADLTASEREQSGVLRARIEKAERDTFVMRQRLERLAEDNGMDSKVLLADTGVVEPPKKPETPSGVDQDTFNSRIGGLAAFSMRLAASMPRIAREHRELTGKDLDTEEFIAGMQADLANGKAQQDPELLDPSKRWERQFEVGRLRTERSTADVDRRIKEATEEGRRAGLSEAMLPGQGARVGGSKDSSPVFKALPGQSKLQRPNPGDRYAGARAALESGKYRNAGSGGSMPNSQ